MKLGNPIHVVLLSVVALAAIGFFLLRLLPSGPGLVSSSQAVATSEPSRESAVPGLPVEVLRDAFSHPALTKRYLATQFPDKHPSDLEEGPLEHLVGPLDPAFKSVVHDLPEATEKPGESAVKARQQDGRPKSRIVLKAIIRTTKPLALVTINGNEDVTVGLGEFIDTTHRVTQFTQNAIQITSDEDKTWLYVGHEVTEK